MSTSDSIPHLPVLRLGRSYESLEKIEVKDHRTGEVRALVSTVNGGIVKRDLAKIASSRAALLQSGAQSNGRDRWPSGHTRQN